MTHPACLTGKRPGKNLKFEMLKKFIIDIEPEVPDDIQNTIDYYNSCKP
jgi:hypothetical protein